MNISRTLGRWIVLRHHSRCMGRNEALHLYAVGEEVLLRTGAKVKKLREGGAWLHGYAWDGSDIAPILGGLRRR